MPIKKYYRPRPRAPNHYVASAAGMRVSEDILRQRDERADLDAAAAADDPNVALGFSPPPYRSALAQRK
jgi:hypothetical protein